METIINLFNLLLKYIKPCHSANKLMNSFGTIIRFNIIWIIYWLVYLLQPVQSVYASVKKAWLLQLVFVISLSISYVIGLSLKTPKKIFQIAHQKKNKKNLTSNIIGLGLWLSILGFCFLLYDKVFIQNIDYSHGLAFARQQWLDKSEARGENISSPFSLLGYLFGGGFFLSLMLTLSKKESLSENKRAIFFILSCALLFANCIITGGRSSILLAVSLVSFGFFYPNQNNQKKQWNIKNYKTVLALFFLFSLCYILYIFYLRAAGTNVNIATYSQNFLSYLGLVSKTWFSKIVFSWKIGEFLAVINLAIAYLTHSLSTFAGIIEHGRSSGDSIFGLWLTIGAKLGVTRSAADWFLSGRFPSLPGAIFMQWGFLGLVFSAGILGISAGFLNKMFNQIQSSVLLFFSCGIAECILLLSPFLFAGDFLFFPSMAIGGIFTILTCKCFKKK